MADVRDTETDGNGESIEATLTAALASTYRVLGELDASDGAGVLGRNLATTGDAPGVTGTTDSPDGYGLATPDDARVEGTLSTVGEWLVTVNDRRLLLHTAEDPSGAAGNVLAGHSSNSITAGVVAATISGGGYDDGSTGWENAVFDDYGTIGGGVNNTTGDDDGDPTSTRFGTVGGGTGNNAGGEGSTVGGGEANEATGESATVAGGDRNTAAGFATTVGGGRGNAASVGRATVGGGSENNASGVASTVSGGTLNTASGDVSSVGGGIENLATALRATVGGGENNVAGGHHSTVGGGEHNLAEAKYATVAGGGSNDPSTANRVHDDWGTIAGGGNNQAGVANASGTSNAAFATVGGGRINTARGGNATVGGGSTNTAGSSNATVGGGNSNEVFGAGGTIGGGHSNRTGTSGASKGFYATVPGGLQNVAREHYSFAAGRRARAHHQGSFVWADSTPADVTSTAADQFVVEADGGVGVGTTSPGCQFHVTDSINQNTTDDAGHVALIENTNTGSGSDVLKLEVGNGTPGGANNFLYFEGGGNAVGAIEGDGSGGISLNTSGADYGEYLPRRDRDAEFAPGEIVGVVDGELARETADAEAAMVVTDRSAVTGNSPGVAPEDRTDHDVVAFVGQVPTRIRGPVESGDLVVPSGDDDGLGQAVDLDEWTPTDGPVVGRAWEASDAASDEVETVTVAVGIGGPSTVGPTVGRQRERIAGLEAELDAVRADRERKVGRIDDLEAGLAAVRDENETLRERLSAVEATAGSGSPEVHGDD